MIEYNINNCTCKEMKNAHEIHNNKQDSTEFRSRDSQITGMVNLYITFLFLLFSSHFGHQMITYHQYRKFYTTQSEQLSLDQ